MKAWSLGGRLLACVALITNVGCNSGSSDTPSPPPQAENTAPTVSVDDTSVAEKQTATLTANASDPDGTITSYSWTQKSGESINLIDKDKQSVSFSTPAVTQDAEIVLTITVTDDDGATASTDATVTITANILTVSLQGLVTDSPVPDAQVTAEIGGHSFSTTADENGNYALELAVDDSFVDQVVKVSAQGSEEDSHIKLVSLLGDFGSINNAAGDDDIATKADLFAVNVTHLSTAFAALMEDANEDSPITDAETFSTASTELDSALVLPLATAIKLVTDYSADNPELALPDGVSDTLALVSDIETASDYVSHALSVAPETYDTALAETLSDPEVVSAGGDEAMISIADAYYFLPFNGTGDRIQLNEDGTGEISEYFSSTAFTWSNGDTGVDIDFGPLGWLQSTFFTYLDQDNPQVETQFIILDKNIKWIYQSTTNDQLLVENTSYLHYPNGELPDTEPASWQYVANAVKEAGVVDAADVLLLEVEYNAPTSQEHTTLVDPVTGIVSEHFVSAKSYTYSGDISTGGSVLIHTPTVSSSGVVSLTEETQDWQIEANGHLTIAGPDSVTDIAVLLANEGRLPAFNSQLQQADLKVSQSAHSMVKDASWDDENVPGIYDLGWNFFSSLSYFWIELNPDGSGYQVSVDDRDLSGDLSDDEFFIIPNKWQIDDMGILQIRRYFNNATFEFCIPPEWDTGDDDECALYNDRSWGIYQVTESGEHFMRHTHRFYLDPWRASFGDGSFSGHLLNSSMVDSRSWHKVEQRPVELPESLAGIQFLSSQLSRQKVDQPRAQMAKLMALDRDLKN